jgi:hypothetical protein
MTSTNRFANRLLIFGCGFLLLIVGGATAAAVLVPGIRDAWKDTGARVTDQVGSWLQQTRLAGLEVSWILIAVVALLIVGMVVLIVFIARHGHGHTSRAVTDSRGEHGSTIVESSVAEQAMQDALDGHSEFVASRVSTYKVRRTPVLKVSITCRRGVSPKDAAAIVESKLLALDGLLGRELPALIQVSGGFRARVGKTTRLQ